MVGEQKIREIKRKKKSKNSKKVKEKNEKGRVEDWTGKTCRIIQSLNANERDQQKLKWNKLFKK